MSTYGLLFLATIPPPIHFIQHYPTCFFPPNLPTNPTLYTPTSLTPSPYNLITSPTLRPQTYPTLNKTSYTPTPLSNNDLLFFLLQVYSN